jgi:Raf kinase inhibitor-like YbhB/YbcL family protein
MLVLRWIRSIGRVLVAVAPITMGLSVVACSDDSDGNSTSSDDDGGPGGGGVGGAGASGGMGGGGGASGGSGGGGGMLPFALTSTAFAEGEMIPLVHECGPPIAQGPGDNVSPPLTWTPGPTTTQSYAVVMRDLDAGNLVHWVIYDIPASVTSLPEGIPSGYQPPEPAGSKQAELQGVVHSYFGPCSPNSVNTYQWTVHALDVPTLPGVTMDTAENVVAPAVEGMSIASASLSGES